MRFFIALLASIVVASAASPAAAQPAPEDERREAVRQAEAARIAGDHAAAVAFGARAAQLRYSPSLGLLLAQECAEDGRWPEALEHARRCRDEGAAPGVARGQEIVAACAEVYARAEAAAPRPAPATRAAAPVAPAAPATPAVAHVAPRPRQPSTRSWGPGHWVLAGAGAAAAAVGAALLVARGSAVDARDAACDAAGCDPSSLEYDARASAMGGAAGVAFALGGAAVLGAGISFALGGSSAPARVAFAVAPSPGGALVLAGGAL